MREIRKRGGIEKEEGVTGECVYIEKVLTLMLSCRMEKVALIGRMQVLGCLMMKLQ